MGRDDASSVTPASIDNEKTVTLLKAISQLIVSVDLARGIDVGVDLVGVLLEVSNDTGLVLVVRHFLIAGGIITGKLGNSSVSGVDVNIVTEAVTISRGGQVRNTEVVGGEGGV